MSKKQVTDMERLLYNYKDNIRKLIELKEKILHSSGNLEAGMPRSTGTTSITELKAIRLCEDKEILKLEEDISAVEEYIRGVSDTEVLIIELKYFRLDLNNKKIAEMLRISESTLYRYLERIRRA